ncbi:MAG: cadmium-translocating P-type ATPase [Gammaproteobacteria bacterium]|nr:cadmium-translocating P-type ATPase [Gammaproteobacteria bacterium]
MPPGSDFSVLIEQQPRRMCCAGCAAVATLIATGGLSGYYRHRDAPSAIAADTGSGAAEYALFDNPDAQAEFVATQTDGHCRAELAVDGIHCAACTWLLEHHLARRDGIDNISVNLSERRASVRWHPEVLPLSQLMAAIRELGYRPRPYLGSTRIQSERDENRRALRRLGVAGIVQMQIGMFAVALYAGAFGDMEPQYRDYLRWASLLLCIPVVCYSASPFFSGALRGLRHAAPGMDLPIALAIGLAFVSSAWFTVRGGGAVYFDSVAMFTFLVLLGRYLEMRARHRAGMASGDVLSLVPAAATRVLGDGQRFELVPVGRLRQGDRILIRPGEALPADGRVALGSSHVDESSISGESMPISKTAGDTVSAGTLNMEGSLTVEVNATGLQTRLGAILHLVDRAQQEKPAIVQLADRASSWFVVTVIVLATLTGWYWYVHDSARTLEIVLSVLVVSCPCALSLATPAAVTAATTALKTRGFLVTRGHALEALANADTVVFDKTGTLTTGSIRLAAVEPLHGNADALLDIAAAMEARSEHPIAGAFDTPPTLAVEDFRAFPGDGIEARIEGTRYRLGSAAFATPPSLAPGVAPGAGKWILLASTTRALAWFRLSDSVRDDAPQAIAELARLGLSGAMLSGDNNAEAGRIATLLGLQQWQGECTPGQKLAAVRAMHAAGKRVVMVGDGINDVAVLAGAGVSVAMANAADVTRANADCMLLGSGLLRIPEAIRVARHTQRVIRQNIGWALLYNFSSIPFAAAGLVPPWLAAIGMSASSLVVVANALRLRQHGTSSKAGELAAHG